MASTPLATVWSAYSWKTLSPTGSSLTSSSLTCRRQMDLIDACLHSWSCDSVKSSRRKSCWPGAVREPFYSFQQSRPCCGALSQSLRKHHRSCSAECPAAELIADLTEVAWFCDPSTWSPPWGCWFGWHDYLSLSSNFAQASACIWPPFSQFQEY